MSEDIEVEVKGWKERGSPPPIRAIVSGSVEHDPLADRLCKEWAIDHEYRARCYDRLADNPGEQGFYYPSHLKGTWAGLSKKYKRMADLARKGMSAYEIAVAVGDWPAGVRSRTFDPDTGTTTVEHDTGTTTVEHMKNGWTAKLMRFLIRKEVNENGAKDTD